MKGIAVFLGLLLISSTATAQVLNADLLPACGTSAGCSMSALYTACTGVSGTIQGTANLVVTSTSGAIVNQGTNLNIQSFTVAGNAVVNVQRNVQLVVNGAFAIASQATMVVVGQLVVAGGVVDQSAGTTVNGALVIAQSAVATFGSGFNLLAGAAFTVGAGASAQISGATSVIAGDVAAAQDAVVAVTGVILTLVGTYTSTATSYLTAVNATVTITTSSTLQATLVLAGGALVQAQGTATAVNAIVAQDVNNVLYVATGAVITVKSNITVIAGSTLKTIGAWIVQNRVRVDGNLTAQPNGVGTPNIAGGIQVSVGSYLTLGANTGIIAQVTSTIQGTLIMANQASITITSGVMTIANLVLQIAAVATATAQTATIIILNFTAMASAVLQPVGDVRYNLNG